MYFILIVLALTPLLGLSQTLMPLPGHSTSFGSMTRGYYFTAPVNFNITGLRVPTDVAGSFQHVEVVRFTADAPPAFPSTTNSFVFLAQHYNVNSTSIIPVSIPVNAGEIIGVYGSRSTSSGAGCYVDNSYGACVAPDGYPTNISGSPTTLYRSGYQHAICNSPAANIWYENCNLYYIGRVELYYGTPLSSSYTNFTGKLSDNESEVILNWSFADENYDYCIVERAGNEPFSITPIPFEPLVKEYTNADGVVIREPIQSPLINTDEWHNKKFTEIGRINTKQPIFTFVDKKPLIGKNYYRIKRVHKDGKYECSNVIEIEYGIKPSRIVNLYPNPVINHVQFEFVVSQNGPVEVELYNVQGKRVYAYTAQAVTGINLFMMNMADFKPGSYFLQIRTRDGLLTKKFVVAN
ncbi:MAG: T9SS type A sorting domain-containing protein [Bacteroidia bacterium]|nr:T9SS type A sorting domain-containing protein [Bacteroidia bacterium]MDW8301118.1 T9SS type A sorting domain-containing protein [Bacteroidia bacterium]